MAFLLLFFIVEAFINIISCRSDSRRHKNVGLMEFASNSPIDIEDAPYMASLQLRDTAYSFLCTAAILDEQFLLTAASCCVHKSANVSLYILVGTNNVYSGDRELLDIDLIFIHDKFDNNSGDYDVCLIKLSKNLKFDSKVGKIQLPDHISKIDKDTKLNVTGWFSKRSHVKRQLHQVELSVISRKKCKRECMNITSHQMCACDLPLHLYSHCEMGSPFTLGDKLIGITSKNFNCGDDIVIFTWVSTVLCWISEQIALHLQILPKKSFYC